MTPIPSSAETSFVTYPKAVSLESDQQRPAPIPPIVNTIRQYAGRQLTGLLEKLLDSTDDALFELADKSSDNPDHHLYFDSMRQIRLHRPGIAQHFGKQVDEGFTAIFKPPANAIGNRDEWETANLEMLRNDDLEVSVAISGIVSKITSQFSLPIMELTKRLDHLAKHASVTERLNPLGPQRVSEAFAAAMGCLEVDIRIRIILLKLFERTVMQNMGPVYAAINQMLAQAGVLKDLRDIKPVTRQAADGRQPDNPASARNARRSQATTSGTSRGGHGGDGAMPGDGYDHRHGGLPGGGDFGVIQSLLAGMRPPSGLAPDPGSLIATAQLLNALSSAQAESGQQDIDIAEMPPPIDLHQLVVARASSQTGRAVSNLHRSDEDVVNFIGLLFDYILNDRNLAIPMKALIARLQIPIVKLAIIDKSFFGRSSHPARQLLNELSSAGIGWSSATELKRDAVYDAIESVVIRVLNEFSDNPEIFQALLEELREFRARDAARNGRMEQRVRETETGKARTAAAKRDVQQAINQKASGLRLPRDLGRFLSDVWSRVLLYANLTEGESSALWQQLIATLDDLLWAVQPLDSMDQVDQRDRTRSDLLDRLAVGMGVIALPGSESKHWLEVLQGQLEEVSRSDRHYLDQGDAPSLDEYEEMEEIVLTEPSEAAQWHAGELPGAEFVELIDALSEGSWVEFLQPEAPSLRCKLATIVEPGACYVFVNRRGMKVAESTRLALARDLEQEKLLILNDSQVFDRALEAVIGNLRKVQSSSPSH
jgi:hypothetical protein